MRLARRVSRVVSALLLAAGIAFGSLLILPALLGLQRYIIVSGSMTGTYDRGSLVLDDVVPTASLKVGDVITYKPPPGVGPNHLLTHRIVAIARGPHGVRVYHSKGDANRVADPWAFTLPNPHQARVRAGIPYVGFVLAALAQRSVRMLLVGVPAAVIALAVLAGLWQETAPEALEAAPEAAEARA